MAQQNSLAIGASNPVRAMTGLAKQMALPGEFAPQRFPSFPALERTAVMGFNAPVTLPIPTTGPVKIMVNRQAAWPAWADQTYTGNSYFCQWATAREKGTTTTTIEQVALPVGAALNYAGVGNQTGDATKLLPTITGASAKFTYPVIGIDEGITHVPFIYIPAGYKYMVAVHSVNTHPVGRYFQVTFNTWTSPGESVLTDIDLHMPINNANGISSVQTAGTNTWFSPLFLQCTTVAALDRLDEEYAIGVYVFDGTPVYTNSGVNSGTFALTPASTQSFLPLVEPAEFSSSTIPWRSTRLTASAMLATNVTQVLNKGGTVLAGRISPTTNDPFNVTSSVINALHPAEKSFLALESGMYTYCPPSTDLAQFWDYTSSPLAVSPGVNFPLFRLDNTALVNVGFLTGPGVAESMAITVSWHLEFRTTSALFQIALSGLTLESFHQAQLVLVQSGFFFDNPHHKSVLSKIVDAARRFGPVAAGVVGLVHPTAGRVLSYLANSPPTKRRRGKGRGSKPAAATVIPKKGPAKVAPTTMRAALPPKKKGGLSMFLDSRR